MNIIESEECENNQHTPSARQTQLDTEKGIWCKGNSKTCVCFCHKPDYSGWGEVLVVIIIVATIFTTMYFTGNLEYLQTLKDKLK